MCLINIMMCVLHLTPLTTQSEDTQRCTLTLGSRHEHKSASACHSIGDAIEAHTMRSTHIVNQHVSQHVRPAPRDSPRHRGAKLANSQQCAICNRPLFARAAQPPERQLMYLNIIAAYHKRSSLTTRLLTVGINTRNVDKRCVLAYSHANTSSSHTATHCSRIDTKS